MKDYEDWFEDNEARLSELFIEEHGREPTPKELEHEAQKEYDWLANGWDNSDRAFEMAGDR